MANKQNRDARIAELEAQLKTSQEAELANGKAAVGILCFIRDAYVKTISKAQLESSTYGKAVFEFLVKIEAKAPATKCGKCFGAGLVEVSNGNWYNCFGCTLGRILGHPGQAHIVDVKVHEAYLKNLENQNGGNGDSRFTRQGPSAEEIAQAKAIREAAKSASSQDIPY